jgi:hypothetical protein
VPWKALLDLIEPHYPVAGRGRRPYPLESMLRVHLMQNWFALSDPAMDEALYEIASLRAFAHLSLGEPIPDETIIAARSSTKNQDGERDPEMHQTKKGNQWHFGMKAHIAVDAHSGLVHTVTTTAANESDVEQVAEPKGATQVWLPVPDLDTDWQRTVDNSWAGNASRAALVSDPARGVRMLHAEFAAGVTAPVLTLTSRVQTRNRAAAPDAGRVPAEDVATLRAYLGPTELQPVDGIVRKTALDATRGARTDEQKARALYEWVWPTRTASPGRAAAAGRHQDHAGNRQPGRQVRRPERAVRRPVPLGGHARRATCTACAWRLPRSAIASWAATPPA